MPLPILTTKLYVPPPRPNLVRRPRLIQRLNAGLHSKLILISAPAGFGKSTLVSEWVAGSQQPTAWLSLDSGDSDPTRFLTYFVAALQSLPMAVNAERFGKEALEMLQSPMPPASDLVLTTLLNEIAATRDDFVLVLDDYHAIDSTAVDAALAFLLEHLPPPMHLVITTREDPALPLARYRARGQMTELRAADLRFSPAEAAGFFRQAMGLELSAADVAALEARTEGWIAGLQMAALSMQGRGDTSAFIRAFTGSHRFVLDYLVEEVLQRQPEPVRDFLLQTAILHRLSGGLCDAVTDQTRSAEMLAALERGNLFVVALDDQRQWYRYHHLFADVLQARGQEIFPHQMPILHQRASDWYAAKGETADAIRHALAAQDFQHAAGLIELAWPEMDGTFQSAPWLNWASALPEKLIRARPVLCVAYAWALLNEGEMEAAAARLRDAEACLAAAAQVTQHGTPPQGLTIVDEEQFRFLPASIASAWTYHAQAFGDIPASIRYAQQALELLPETEYLRRGPAASLLGLAQWGNGDLEAAHRSLAEAMAGFQMAGNLHFALSGTYGLADIRIVQGRLRAAVDTYEQALRLATEQEDSVIRGTADLHLGLSELFWEQGDDAAAATHMRKSEEFGESGALPDWPFRLRRAQARFAADQGDLDGALALFDQAEQLYFPTPVPEVRPISALKVPVWLAQGRLADALGWVQERGLSVDDDLSFLREYEHITLARVLMAQHKSGQADGALREAIGLLKRLLQAAETGERMGSVIQILLVQALAYQLQGDVTLALAALGRALSLAQPEGYVRIFVDEGLAMAALLQEAAKQGTAPGYVQRLLAAFGENGGEISGQNGGENESVAEDAAPASQELIEPLSEREMDVLRLLTTELSGPEIARKLMVSLNTMRTHTKNIYSKLGVNSRRAAVNRAQELGLI